jgi:hypothetical protein
LDTFVGKKISIIAATELGQEAELHWSRDCGRGLRIDRDPSGKLVQGWFVRPDHTSDRKLDTRNLIKNESRR